MLCHQESGPQSAPTAGGRGSLTNAQAYKNTNKFIYSSFISGVLSAVWINTFNLKLVVPKEGRPDNFEGLYWDSVEGWTTYPMSDSDERIIRNPGVDAELGTEASTATTRTPGTVLRALLAHDFTTPNTPSPSFSAIPPPHPPPPPPLSRSSSWPNQHVCIASEILPRLFISDIFTALNLPALRSSCITHIISVVEYAVTFPTLSQRYAESKSCGFSGSLSELDLLSHPPQKPVSLPLTTLHVPLADLPAEDIFSYFAITKDFITTALQDENARVLVHCYKGQSRSPTIVAAYLISTLKVSTSDALMTIKAKRPMVLPNRGFLRQLEQWAVVVREEDEMLCSDK